MMMKRPEKTKKTNPGRDATKQSFIVNGVFKEDLDKYK